MNMEKTMPPGRKKEEKMIIEEMAIHRNHKFENYKRGDNKRPGNLQVSYKQV